MTLPHSPDFRYRPHVFAAFALSAAALTLLYERDPSRVGPLALIGVLWSFGGFAFFWVGLHLIRVASGRESLWLSRLVCLICFYFFSAGSVLLVVLVLIGFDIGMPRNDESLFFATSPGGFAGAAAAYSVLAKTKVAV